MFISLIFYRFSNSHISMTYTIFTFLNFFFLWPYKVLKCLFIVHYSIALSVASLSGVFISFSGQVVVGA